MPYLYCNRNRSRPCMSVTFYQVSKLGMHPDILPRLVYIINLLKNYKEDENSVIDKCIFFVVLIFIYTLCSYKLVFLIPLEVLSEFSKLPFVI